MPSDYTGEQSLLDFPLFLTFLLYFQNHNEVNGIFRDRPEYRISLRLVFFERFNGEGKLCEIGFRRIYFINYTLFYHLVVT